MDRSTHCSFTLTPEGSPPQYYDLNVAVSDIEPSPTNPRKAFSAEKQAELAESIRRHGILQPLLLRPWPESYAWNRPPLKVFSDGSLLPSSAPRYELVAGERRFRAANEAGLASVPVRVRELSTAEVIEIQLIENLQRDDLHPLEEAEGYERMMRELDITADQVGEKIGKSRSYIFGRLKLLDLTEEARRCFFAGTINSSIALLVARIPGETLQKRALHELTTQDPHGDNMPVRAAQQYLQHRFMLRLDEASFAIDDACLVAKAGSCSDCPKRSGNAGELFADVQSPDVCTDPDCFAGKRQAHIERVAALAKSSGATIITGDDAGKIINRYGYVISGEHRALDDKCFQDKEKRTFREIAEAAGVEVSTVLVELPESGEFVALAETRQLAAALEKAGIMTTQQDRARRDQEDHADRQAKKLLREIEVAWRKRLFAATHSVAAATIQGDAGLRPFDLREIVGAIFEERQEIGEDTDEIALLWGFSRPDNLGVSEDSPSDLLQKRLATMTPGELSVLLIDLVLFREVDVSPWNTSTPPTRLVSLSSRYGIDPDSILRDVTAELSPPDPASPEGGESAAETSDEGTMGEGESENSAANAANEEPKATATSIAFGSRVRVRDDAKGANGRSRKCCGREGVVVSDASDGTLSVQFGEGSRQVIVGLAAEELEVLP